MKILFKNAKILVDPRNPVLLEGDLVTSDSVIDFVGKKAPDDRYNRTIDCHGDLLIPAFKNSHTHSAMTFARSLADDLPLGVWLTTKIFPYEDHLTSNDVYVLSKVAFLEYLTSGISTCFDMYYFPEAIKKAAVDVGFRTVILGTITKSKQSLKEMEEAYKTLPDDNLVSYVFGYHAEYTSDEEILKGLSELTHKYKAPCYTHSCETKKETEGCKERHRGLSPIAYMEDLGLLDYGGGIFHGVYASDEDLDILKKHNATFVTCPGSNSKLASGIAPLTKVLDHNINLAVGTDGPSSNNALDMFYEMRLMCVLQKLKLEDASAFPAHKALEAATVGGSIALNLLDVQTLNVGQKADITRIDLMNPAMQPINNILDNLVYSGSKDCVKMTMVNGRILYEDHEFFIGEDVDELYKQAQAITERLKNS